MAQVATLAHGQSLTQELPHAMDMVSKKKGEESLVTQDDPQGWNDTKKTPGSLMIRETSLLRQAASEGLTVQPTPRIHPFKGKETCFCLHQVCCFFFFF